MISDDNSTEADTDPGVRLHIQGLQDGNILSGEVEIVISTIMEHDCENEINLLVDGNFRGLFIAHPEREGHRGARQGSFYLDTYRYSNAKHAIAVTDGSTCLDTRKVIFQNVFSDILMCSFLDADPPSTSEFPYLIGATVTPPQQWRVEINTLNGTLVKRFEGQGGSINLRWDGTDERSDPADDAPYLVTMSADEGDVTAYAGFINKLSP